MNGRCAPRCASATRCTGRVSRMRSWPRRWRRPTVPRSTDPAGAGRDSGHSRACDDSRTSRRGLRCCSCSRRPMRATCRTCWTKPFSRSAPAPAGSVTRSTACRPSTTCRGATLKDIPTVVVTGSNGKTTTVRLVAACARRHGWRAGYNCTDGVVIGGESIASGDYSGPAGTRLVLRDQRVEAAVLETARGGILRRGIAVRRAHAAVVTNVSCDHFGEYGIHDLDGLADVKLSVASVVAPGGLLVLNADDQLLRLKAGGAGAAFRAPTATGVVRARRRLTGAAGASPRRWRDLRRARWPAPACARKRRARPRRPWRQMPLTVDGSATTTWRISLPPHSPPLRSGLRPRRSRAVFAEFGSDPADNKGRLMRFDVGGVTVLVDYAHNPARNTRAAAVAQHLRRRRDGSACCSGHAGNRQDSGHCSMSRSVAAGFEPDLVVLRRHEAHLRGREPGEVPRIIRAELVRAAAAGVIARARRE